ATRWAGAALAVGGSLGRTRTPRPATWERRGPRGVRSLAVGPGGLGQRPLLVGVAGAVPDLQLRPRRGRPAGVVQALVRLRVVQRAVGLGDEDLRAGVVAVVQVHLGAVGGAAADDVHALAQDMQGAARRDHGPLLRRGAVAGVDLDRVGVGRAGRPVVDAQAAVPDDRAGARGRG